LRSGDPGAQLQAQAAGQPVPPPLGPETGFYRFTASHYVLHYLETQTGYRFVLTSDAAAGDLRPALWHLYEALFVVLALKNPAYTPGAVVEVTGFALEVDRYVRALPAFSAR
jgi:hypothetical protein